MRAPSRRIRRTAAFVGLVWLLLVALAGPAAAHGRGSDATNFSSQVTDTPQLPGIDWRISGGDEFLQVTNSSDSELLILGYSDEPYARVGAEGVFTNANSPATYQNQDRYATTALPPNADAQAQPEWTRVSDGTSFAWHDHRVHWMAPVNPPQVAAQPDAEQVIQRWTVPFTLGGAPQQISGELRWIPAPSPWPWLLVGLVLALPALAGLRSADAQRPQRLARPAAVVLGVIVAGNLIHLVDDLFASPLPVSTKAFAAVQTALFLGLGAFGAVRGWQGREGAFTALGIGSGAVFLGQGMLYLTTLTTSQSASLFPEAVSRLVVAASIAQVLPVIAVAVLGTRRALPPVQRTGMTGAPAEA